MRDFYFLDLFSESLLDILDGAYYKSPYVKEASDKYMLTVEIPGIKEKDLEMTFEKGSFKLKYPNKRDPTYKQTLQSFVSENVNENDIKATLEDGVLTVTFPKKNSSTIKTIKISKS